ncbi:MAG: 6-bladed beta-propeller [Candidatus Aminicenantes bacterium]|nr:6-bladed beta-propeller [Candidatus Aminicenantes bacterium]
MKKNFLFGLLSTLFCLLFNQVVNPDKPEKGSWDLQMKKIWEIDSAGNDVFGDIQEINVTADGKVFVLDAKNFRIFIFNKDGNFISAFGRRGEGPGEIKNLQMGSQLFIVGNRIIVVDRGRIHYFTREGKFIKTALYPFQTKPQTFVSEDVFISAPATIDDPRNSEAKVKLYNLKDKTEKVIATFKPYKKATASEENRGNQFIIAIIIDEITPLMMVKYREGKIYYGMSSHYLINVVNLQGKPITRFGIEGRKQNPISSAYKKKLAQQFKDAPQEMVKKIINGLPETASFFYEIFIDKNGLAYLFISSPDSKSRKKLDIFSPEGKYIYSSEIRVDTGLTIKYFTLKNKWIFIATEDEEGNQMVSKFSIKLPEVINTAK